MLHFCLYINAIALTKEDVRRITVCLFFEFHVVLGALIKALDGARRFYEPTTRLND